MPNYIVTKEHDSPKGVLVRGRKVAYSEALGKELVKKGFLAPLKKPVIVEPKPTELLEKISKKRSKKQLNEMLEGEKRQVVIEAINNRLKELK